MPPLSTEVARNPGSTQGYDLHTDKNLFYPLVFNMPLMMPASRIPAFVHSLSLRGPQSTSDSKVTRTRRSICPSLAASRLKIPLPALGSPEIKGRFLASFSSAKTQAPRRCAELFLRLCAQAYPSFPGIALAPEALASCNLLEQNQIPSQIQKATK